MRLRLPASPWIAAVFAAFFLPCVLSGATKALQSARDQNAFDDFPTPEKGTWPASHPVIRFGAERSFTPGILLSADGKLEGIP